VDAAVPFAPEAKCHPQRVTRRTFVGEVERAKETATMLRRNASIALVFCGSFGLFACGGSQTPPEAPNGGTAPVPAPPPVSTEGVPSRAEVTAEACESGGGKVVGDIGDGAIHRPDYRCPGGAAPTGNIRAPEGGPMAVEGSVCCPQ
jgi:hypothetical protein